MINQFLERIRSHIIIEEAELTDAENEGVKGVINIVDPVEVGINTTAIGTAFLPCVTYTMCSLYQGCANWRHLRTTFQ